MTIPEQAVQAETLWAVNTHDPDDLIAAPDYLSAVRMSNAFNAWWLSLKVKHPHNDAIDARMWAVPTDWPENDAQAHADELSKPHPEYQWLRDASAAPHLAAVWVNVDEIEAARKAVEELAHVQMNLPLEDWSRISSAILSALEPSAARELALEDSFRKGLEAACEVIDAHSEYDLQLCCNGRECGCGGATVHQSMQHYIRALHPVADKPDEAGAQGIERGKFYHHQWPMEKLLEARRDGLVDHSGGEAWRYEYSHKDEHGKYDILYRPVKISTILARLPTPPSSEVA
ncbi:hypothetical protein [Ochrobactrum sp. RH2CCR150]|uniref:hypothetical protein n=1 Tax=Ochrobactrum sp. RH2CCR150 TaxID=2587044 RepID=UPI0015FC4DEA|nr:hypothetical protein [Ochrobactrum sp. RH2CCR150]